MPASRVWLANSRNSPGAVDLAMAVRSVSPGPDDRCRCWSGVGHHGAVAAGSTVPVELSTFVGRSAELDRVERLLADARLLTLTGAGGCGKTRLLRQLGRRVLPAYPDGVWWVELAALTDPALVADQVCRSVGFVTSTETPLVEGLAEFLRDSRCLILVDNCEHLLEAAASVVAGVLARTTEVKIVATSRQPLRVEGEVGWRVPSLSLPDSDDGSDTAGLSGSEAVALFVERAAQAGSGLELTGTTGPAIAQICRRLDGLPLALELAAARTATVPLDRIVRGLDDRFALLVGGHRTALPRYQTLAESVNWSYRLLEPDEQVLFRRLGVFTGGFTADAAEQVAGSAPLSPADVLTLVAALTSKSLIQLESPAGAAPRYRMLETIREFAAGLLADSGDGPRVRQRHTTWAASFAAGWEDGATAAQGDALDALVVELPNLRAALDCAASGPLTDDAGLRLVASTTFLWPQRGLAAEGADRAAAVVAANEGVSSALVARAGAAGAYNRFYTFDFDRCMAEAKTALTLAEQTGDLRTQGRCWHVLAAATVLVDPAASIPLFARALELAREAGDTWCEADSMQFLGWGRLIQHRPADVGDWLERSAAMARQAGNAFQLGWHQLAVGNLHTAAGQLQQAETELRSGIALARQLGDPAVEVWGCASLAVVTLLGGQPARLRSLADSMDRAGRPLGPVGAALVASFRVLAADPPPDRAAAALAAAAQPLLAGHDPSDGARLLLLAGVRLASAGNASGAQALLPRCREACTGLSSSLAGACDVLEARLVRRAGDAAVAQRLAHRGLGTLAEAGMWVDVPDALRLLGGLAIDAGADAEGLRLLAAADAAGDTAGAVDPFATDSARDASTAVERLGASAETVKAEGAGLDPAGAVAYASRARGERRRPAFGWDSLTPTELAVVRLAAAGLTNPAIGEQLFISRGTVKTHLEHVFAKLGVRTRAQLAAAAARRGDGP